MLAGFCLQYTAFKRYGSATAPKGLTLNPKHWRLGWTASDWFDDPRGHRLFRIGDVLVMVGLVFAVTVIVVHNRTEG
jgi:hypothetical protein